MKMKIFKKLLIGMMIFSLTSTNLIINLTPAYATENSEARVETEEKTVKDLQDRLKTLDENIVAKDNLNEELQVKVEKLEREKGILQEELTNLKKELEEKIRTIADLKLEISNLESRISALEQENSNLKDEVKRAKLNIPNDIKIGQWYPETIIKYPTKRQYKNNEDIDLSGMQVRFSKYVKENDEYKMINEEVDFETFKNEIHGWEFRLKTPKAIYNKDTNGKMQIKFSFVLKNDKKSME